MISYLKTLTSQMGLLFHTKYKKYSNDSTREPHIRSFRFLAVGGGSTVRSSTEGRPRKLDQNVASRSGNTRSAAPKRVSLENYRHLYSQGAFSSRNIAPRRAP